MSEHKKVIQIKKSITYDVLTKFEIARILNLRCLGIGKDSIIYIKYDEIEKSKDSINEFEGINTEDIARQELNQGKCPFLIYRVVHETDDTIYVDIKDPNKMLRPIL